MKLPEFPPDTAPAVRDAFEALARESAELRAEVEALKSALAPRPVARPVTAPAPVEQRRDEGVEHVTAGAPVASTARTVTARPRIDMEKLLGRYGAWAAATLMILLGVGTLLEWAIRNGLFGPAARVALSSALAVALAVGGYVLRKRAAAAGESQRFGNACLGLALGVLDVVAWQVGPQWHMVPTPVALMLAVVGAGALVSFGVRESDELLAAVGAAGLYLAPFVTSSGEGSPLVLAAYVVLVSVVLFRFVEQPAWSVARSVVRWGSLLSVFALAGMGEAVLGAIVAAALALAMLDVDAPVAQRLGAVGAYLAVAIITTLAAPRGHPATWDAALALDRHTGWLASAALLVATLMMSRVVLRLTAADLAGATWNRAMGEVMGAARTPLIFTVILPVAAVLAAASALPGDTRLDMLWLGTATGLIALGVALTAKAPLARDYFTTGFVLLWSAAISYSPRDVQMSEAMLLGVAVVALWMVATRPEVTIARGAAFLSAVAVALVSASRMYAAEQYPVARAWLDTLLMAGAFLALVWIARVDMRGEHGAERDRARTARLVMPWVAGLLLARHLVVLASGAYSAVALTAFYAASGVALIVLGRHRDSLALRRAGLGLALYAPLRAVATTADVENTGVRVAVYFVAGAFMLLVAFLYRTRAAGEPRPIAQDTATPE